MTTTTVAGAAPSGAAAKRMGITATQGSAQKRRKRVQTVVLEPTRPHGYSVSVPALPGVVTSGDTIEEALAMAREAIGLHLRGMIEDGEPIPIEPPPKRKVRRVRLPIRVAA